MRMNSKKVMALIGSVVLVMGVAAGCAAPESQSAATADASAAATATADTSAAATAAEQGGAAGQLQRSRQI